VKKVLNDLKKPEAYPHAVREIKVVSTHISHVILTGDYAYKFKRPDAFAGTLRVGDGKEVPLVDYSTPQKQRECCEKEVAYNSEFCPEIYDGLVDLFFDGENYNFKGEGRIVGCAVRMKQFKEENIFKNALLSEKFGGEELKRMIKSFARNLWRVHKKSEARSELSSAEYVKAIVKDNFDTCEKLGVKIDDRIINKNYNFIKENAELLGGRAKKGFVVRTHGDLHSNNMIVLDNELKAFDCIEFNPWLWGDVASDVGFLYMELKFLGKDELAEVLVEEYEKTSGDKDLRRVLPFFAAYRAFVLMKVKLIQNQREEALKYYELSKALF
jgi:aminoglycoside phosphotransferase family enzyme